MAFLVQSTDSSFTSFVTLSDGTLMVVFDVSPKITESQSVTYTPKTIPQLPTSINYFDSVSARTFNVANIKLISRTSQEADQNNKVVHYLRSLAKVSFGQDLKEVDGKSAHKLGMPPKILLLRGYRNENSQDQFGGISNIPVVITNIEIDWPDDVDYIPDLSRNPTPIIRTMSLGLLETHSPAEIMAFNYDDYKAGKLLNW